MAWFDSSAACGYSAAAACGYFRGGGVRRLSSRGVGVRCAAVRALFSSGAAGVGRFGSPLLLAALWRCGSALCSRSLANPPLLRRVRNCQKIEAPTKSAISGRPSRVPVGPPNLQAGAHDVLDAGLATEASLPPQTRSRRGSVKLARESCHTRGQHNCTLQRRCRSSEIASFGTVTNGHQLWYGS